MQKYTRNNRGRFASKSKSKSPGCKPRSNSNRTRKQTRNNRGRFCK